MLVELFRRANDCEIRRNRLRHELGRLRLFPSAFEQAKPFKEDELLRVPGPVVQLLLDVGGQLAPRENLQRLDGVLFGVSGQLRRDLGLRQFEYSNNAPLDQVAQRPQSPLGCRREKQRLDMHLEVGQHRDFRRRNLTVYRARQTFRHPKRRQESTRRFNRAFLPLFHVGHVHITQQQWQALQKPLDKPPFHLRETLRVPVGNRLAISPISPFALDEIAISAFGRSVGLDFRREVFRDQKPRVVQSQVFDQRRGAEPDAAWALRQQFQETPPDLGKGDGGHYAGGTTPRVKRVEPAQRPAAEQLIVTVAKMAQVNLQNPLFLCGQWQSEKLLKLLLGELNVVVRKARLAAAVSGICPFRIVADTLE